MSEYDITMDRLKDLNSKIMGEPPAGRPKVEIPPTDFVERTCGAHGVPPHGDTADDEFQAALALMERQPAARISCPTVAKLFKLGIINDWELTFLLDTSGQEPLFTPIPWSQLKEEPLSYKQTVRRVLIVLKVLRFYNRATIEHYRYLDKIRGAD